MNMLRLLAVTVILGALTTSANAQTVDINDLLNQLIGGGGLSGLTGNTGGGDIQQGDVNLPGTGGTTSTGDQAQEDRPIAQESLRRFRERRPGLDVQAGIADYRARSSNVGRLGPFEDQTPPDLEEDVRVLPIIINDLLGSAFSLVNQVISAGNLLTSLQLGTLGSGTGGGFDLNSLLQQFLGSSGAKSIEQVKSEIVDLPATKPSTSVVVPVVPVQDQTDS